MNVSRRLLSVLLWLAATLAGVASAVAATESGVDEAARPRLAIVIGNSAYSSSRYEDLANASNDATRLSESLKRLNFEVATGINLTSAQMDELFRRYQPKLSAYSSVLIFYAGHGIQISGENYLLPVDTLDPESVGKLTERAIKLNDVIAHFASRERQTFIFLDACRNSPLGTGTGGAGDGLAQVEVGENSFIAFATQPGNVTVDGSGTNSPFTSALLQSLEFPGLSISDMMIRVRNETERLTLGKQVPWDQSNLREQFYFTEQQVIDSRELSATLNRILEVPSMKEKLLVQLASADTDLQSTVLLLGRQLPTLRSVDASPTEPAGQQLASLDLGDRKTVASDIESLLVLGKSQETQENAPAFDLNRRVQTELSRVGCYRQQVDGEWGPGSRRALSDYLKRTKQNEGVLEPSVELLGDLFLRSGRICRQPVAAPKTATLNKQSTGKKTKATTSRADRKPPRTARSRPAAPPPDIGAGIGIGGIF